MLRRLRELEQKHLLLIKTLFFFINLQYFTIHQFREKFSIAVASIDMPQFGRMIGLISLGTFLTNIAISSLVDHFQLPKAALITTLMASCFFFQLFFTRAVQTSTGLFWLNMFLYLVFLSYTLPLLDRIINEVLLGRKEHTADNYGKQRVFGTLGYVASNYIIESLMGTRDDVVQTYEPLKHYKIVTTVACVLLVIFVIDARRIQRKSSFFKSWGTLLSNGEFMFFILVILLNGITRATLTNFLTGYLKNGLALGKSSTVKWPKAINWLSQPFVKNPTSTTSAAGVFLEIFILWNSNRIIAHLGLYWPLLLAQVFQSLRLLLYIAIRKDTPLCFPLVCLVETFKGVNFGLTHISAQQIALKYSPPDLKTTSQSIYAGTFTGLGSFLAGIVSSQIFSTDVLKGEQITEERRLEYLNLFKTNLVITSVAVILFITKYGLYKQKLGFQNIKWLKSSQN